MRGLGVGGMRISFSTPQAGMLVMYQCVTSASNVFVVYFSVDTPKLNLRRVRFVRSIQLSINKT